MTDETVTVRPVRTFLEGAELKHAGDEPYPVSRSRALELEANGLVERVEAAPAEPPSAEILAETETEAPAEPAAEATPRRPRARRGA
ncbi:MAG: hypothetical protein PGN34_07615 [Methylobacterium frigidaeris]